MMLPVVGDCPMCDDGKLVEHVSRGCVEVSRSPVEQDWHFIYYKHFSNICHHCHREFVTNEQAVMNRKEIQKRKLEAGL